MPVEKVFTIGVYGSTESAFFNCLIQNKIDLFIDIRRRRAVRGSKYSFVNSKKLQDKLKELAVAYIHVLSLAPTKEIREIQKKRDTSDGILKSQRKGLTSEFIREYKENVLDLYDLSELMVKNDYKRVVLFCVEQSPLACHRSIVADEISKTFNLEVTHL
jgi:uncharacterized protein (DUF488 family)